MEGMNGKKRHMPMVKGNYSKLPNGENAIGEEMQP